MPKITVHGGSEPPVTDEEKAANEALEPAGGILEDVPASQSVKPAVNDPKAVWVDYAVSQGHDREAVESKTKAEIVDLFKE